ncbi:amidohydrolase family protein [Pseudomonas typographi]|uniref:Amidohydrolase family protein n=1 Tax=Pseudomonas typographi TaxID=2715964 RepID=A0ABR7YVH6_9PSED|nr:amidohydrolase family protein [Pseudomonas typographi]MBD1585097.1 amidohydrolase family protein [Pseudomonas typographi]MBD1597144.1 amidohydrolase family protein [Pseudomonas typographi]
MNQRAFDLLITGALALDPIDGVARPARLGIVGQCIAYLGADTGAAPPATRHLHLPGRVIVPGFINTHYHAGLNFVRGVAPDCGFAPSYTPGLPQASWLDPQEALALSRLGALEALRAGCTTLVDSFVHAEDTVAGMAETGVRLFASQRLADVDFASVLQGDRRFDRQRGERQLERAETFVQRWAGQAEGRIQAHLTAHAPDTCSVDFLRQINALAHRLGLQISTHLAQSQDELDWVQAKYGRTPVQLLDEQGMLNARLLAGHCIHVSDDDIARIGRSGAHVVHIPLGNAMSGRTAPTRKLLEAGAAMCLATDTMHGDMIEVMRWALAVGRLQAGKVADDWQPADVLRMATANGAAALGWGDRLGSLKVGQLADLAILDYRQLHLTPCIDALGSLVHNATGADVETVIVNGQIVIEQGRSTRVDEAQVRAEAASVCRALWQRCPNPLRAYPSSSFDSGVPA